MTAEHPEACGTWGEQAAALADSAPWPIWCIGPDLRVCDYNAAFTKLLGPSLYPPPWRGRVIDEMLTSEAEKENWRVAVENALSGLRSTLLQGVSASGRVAFEVAPWRDHVGQPAVVVHASFDLGRASRLDAMLATAVDPIILIDEVGTITDTNLAVRTVFGWEPSELVGKNVKVLMPPPFHEQHDGYLQRYRETGERRVIGFGREVVGRRKDGTDFPLELAVGEVTVGNHRVFGGIARDISDRKAAERALRQSEARYRELFENASDLIQSVDEQGRFQFVNRAWLEALGYGQEEVPALTLDRIIAPESMEHCRAIFTRILEGERLAHVEAVFVRSNGGRLAVEGSVSVAQGADGKAATRGIFRDITKRKELEAMKAEFVSVVSHELRTPLTSIRGALGLLEGGAAGPIPAKAAELLRIAHQNTNRLVRLINDILDLDKMEAGRLDLRLERLDAAALAETALQSMQGLADQRGVEFELSVLARKVVDGDADRLQQVLANLLSNAVKYSPRGGTVRVVVESMSRDGVRFRVVDEGPGIESRQLPRLFQKFQQLDSSDARAKGGTGLGLAIAKAIVEQHGGRIGVASELGRGSTFFVELPAAASVPRAEPLPSSSSVSTTVLLVEDDREVAHVVKGVLARDGYQVMHAASVAEVTRALDACCPNVVLLDMAFCDGTGVEVVRMLRSRPPTEHVPIVVLSAREREGGTTTEAFFADWVPKPFGPGALRSALRRAVRGDTIPRALVVDDDADARYLLVVTLAELGVQATEAADGASAVALVRSMAPDLIILDLGMPGMDGFQVLEALRDGGIELPVVVYTGRDLTPEDRARLAKSACRHVAKAIDSEGALTAAIQQVLRQAGNRGDPGGRSGERSARRR